MRGKFTKIIPKYNWYLRSQFIRVYFVVMHQLNANQKAVLSKLMKFCAYQERCNVEVLEKLSSLGIYGDEAGELIIELSRQGFLDEERFAKSYARGKFRMKHWGRVKITLELKHRHISEYCLRKGLEEIDETEYLATMNQLATNYLEKMAKERNAWTKRKKTSSYLIGKGYEPELVYSLLKELT